MFLSLILITFSTVAVDPGMAADFYVSPGGSDSNQGRIDSPFATLATARDAVRKEIAENHGKDITIILREGRYTLGEGLVFGPEDSGAIDQDIYYRAAPGETVVISGGRAITGWIQGDKNRWTVTLSQVAEGTWRFRQLFRDGIRLPRGRFPNAPELMRVAGVSEDLTGIVLDTSLGVESLSGSNAELVMYQNWSVSRVTIDSSNDRTLKLSDPMGWVGHGDATCASTNKPTYVENALAFVDTPGEWYLDEATGVLTYQAEEGEDPNNHSFIAPVATDLIKVAGTASTPVRNVHFEGIQFCHARWELPGFGYRGIQAGHYGTTTTEPTLVLPLAISYLHAEGGGLKNCRISNIGACGVGLGAGARGIRIEGCTFEDIGGNGLMVGWRGIGELSSESEDEDRTLAADWSNPQDVPLDNVVTGNLFERCGAVNHGCVGIYDAFAKGTVISHNVVRDMPYTGISVGFRWNESNTSQRGGLIAYNHVFDVMKMLADGGCLYTLGYQPGAIIRGNVFHDVHRSSFAHGGAPNNGIFFDQGSKGFAVEENTIYNTSGQPIRFNQTNEENMTWGNNQFGVGFDVLPAQVP